jgi:enamine deaminase RidA (YjgF/YER057c/UK114 family)
MKQIFLFLFSISILNIAFVQILNAQNRNNNSSSRKVATKQNKSQMKPKVRFINPTTLSKPPGYTHVVEVTRGKTIYIAGQIALDRSGNIVGREDFRAQTEQVFENLKLALEAVGATFNNVIKLNMYVVDISQLQALREVRDKYINAETPPASTLVEVRKLARDELLIEIEAVAVLPE